MGASSLFSGLEKRKCTTTGVIVTPISKTEKTSTDKCDILLEFTDIPFIDTARRSMQIHNAGGSSNISEALSMQYMYHTYGAVDFIPEMEAIYWVEYKMVDYIMTFPDGEKAGVSVTRAVSYPFDEEFNLDKARALMERKLYGLIVARECISEEQSFLKSIIHVWCMNEQTAQNIEKAFVDIVEADRVKTESMGELPTYSDVSLICTVCSNLFIYTNRPFPK